MNEEKLSSQKLIDSSQSCLFSLQRSEWTCCMMGDITDGFCFTPLKGQHPNFFWRWMQYLCLGFKWVKTKKSPARTG